MQSLRMSIQAVVIVKWNGWSRCSQCAAVPHCKSRFYRDQCICSKSTASPKFVSVSRRLMITAMAASSLLRLLRPGPTTLSKSSWEFSPKARWRGTEKRERQGRLRGEHSPWCKTHFMNQFVSMMRVSTHKRFPSWECSSLGLILWTGFSWQLQVRCLSVWHLESKRGEHITALAATWLMFSHEEKKSEPQSVQVTICLSTFGRNAL